MFIKEYLYEDLKSMANLSIGTNEININGITIYHIDELQFHEHEQEYVDIQFLIQNEVIASVAIQQDEKLVVDENNCYMIVPVEGMEL